MELDNDDPELHGNVHHMESDHSRTWLVLSLVHLTQSGTFHILLIT